MCAPGSLYSTPACRSLSASVRALSPSSWVALFRSSADLSLRKNRSGNRSCIQHADLWSLLAKLGDPTTAERTAAFNRGRRPAQRVHVSMGLTQFWARPNSVERLVMWMRMPETCWLEPSFRTAAGSGNPG